MYNKLINLGDYFDSVGLYRYADSLDKIIKISIERPFEMKGGGSPIRNIPLEELEKIKSGYSISLPSDWVLAFDKFKSGDISLGEYYRILLSSSSSVVFSGSRLRYIIPNSSVVSEVDIYFLPIKIDFNIPSFYLCAYLAMPMIYNISGVSSRLSISSELESLFPMIDKLYISDFGVDSISHIDGKKKIIKSDKSRLPELDKLCRSVAVLVVDELDDGGFVMGQYDNKNNKISIVSSCVLSGDELKVKRYNKSLMYHELRHKSDYAIRSNIYESSKEKEKTSINKKIIPFIEKYLNSRKLSYGGYIFYSQEFLDGIKEFVLSSDNSYEDFINEVYNSIYHDGLMTDLCFGEELVHAMEDSWISGFEHTDGIEIELLKDIIYNWERYNIDSGSSSVLKEFYPKMLEYKESIKSQLMRSSVPLDETAAFVDGLDYLGMLKLSLHFMYRISYAKKHTPVLKKEKPEDIEFYNEDYSEDIPHGLRSQEYETYLGDIQYEISNVDKETLSSFYEELKAPMSYLEKENKLFQFGLDHSPAFKSFISDLPNSGEEEKYKKIKDNYILMIFNAISSSI